MLGQREAVSSSSWGSKGISSLWVSLSSRSCCPVAASPHSPCNPRARKKQQVWPSPSVWNLTRRMSFHMSTQLQIFPPSWKEDSKKGRIKGIGDIKELREGKKMHCDWRETEKPEDWMWGKWLYREEKQENWIEAASWKRDGEKGACTYKRNEVHGQWDIWSESRGIVH